MDRFKITLYRQSPGYSLGSCSLGCLHVQVRQTSSHFITSRITRLHSYMQNYLLLWYGEEEHDWNEHITFVNCPWESHTPSGRLPCVEVYDRSSKENTLVSSTSGTESDLEEAEYIIGELERILSISQHRTGFHGMNDALYCLLRSHVVPGVIASLWMDQRCRDSVTVPLYGHGLPWPLTRLLPWEMKRTMTRRYGARYDAILQQACQALESCAQIVGANRKDTSICTYAIDPEAPMSSDSLLISLLSMIRCLPLHTVLRNQSRSLDWYLDGMMRHHGLGTMTSVVADTKWAGVRSQERGPSDTEHQQQGRVIESKAAAYWLTGVGTIAVGYVTLMLLHQNE